VAVNRALRRAGWYGAERVEPDLKRWLDLVALGTVCDVVPLTGINRALVAQGLKVMAGRGNTGLAALADVARLSEPPGSYHAGFLWARGSMPAAGWGRRGWAPGSWSPRTRSRPANSPAAWTATIRAPPDRGAGPGAAIAQFEGAEIQARMAPGLVFAAARGWHAGVIGIVASRLKERYGRPACVVAIDGEGERSARAPAARSPASISAARHRRPPGGAADQRGRPCHGGGLHRRRRQAGRASGVPGRAPGRRARRRAAAGVLDVDGALQTGAATAELLGLLERLAPFGSGNAEPRFVLPAVRVVYADPVGEDHIRCVIRQRRQPAQGHGLPLPRERAGPPLLMASGSALHLAGHLRLNRWQGARRCSS
jgi:Single-stranded DNA-specific exonuclease